MESISEFDSLAGSLARRGEVAFFDLPARDDGKEEASLRALARFIIEQALRAREPAVRSSRLAPGEQVDDEPEAASRGTRDVAPSYALGVRPRPEVLAGLVQADQVGRYRKPLYVLKL